MRDLHKKRGEIKPPPPTVADMAVLAHRLKSKQHLTEAEAGFIRVTQKMVAREQPDGTAQASRVRGLGHRLCNGHPGQFSKTIWHAERRPDLGQVASIYGMAGRTP